MPANAHSRLVKETERQGALDTPLPSPLAAAWVDTGGGRAGGSDVGEEAAGGTEQDTEARLCHVMVGGGAAGD